MKCSATGNQRKEAILASGRNNKTIESVNKEKNEEKEARKRRETADESRFELHRWTSRTGLELERKVRVHTAALRVGILGYQTVDPNGYIIRLTLRPGFIMRLLSNHQLTSGTFLQLISRG